MADLTNTLQGQALPMPAATTPNERPEDAAFRRLTEMVEQGQLKLTEDARKMLGMEREAIQAEPVPAAPGPAQTFGAALGGILGSQFTGNPAIAQNVLGTLDERSRTSQQGAAQKVARLRDLRQRELQAEISAAEDAQDTKVALAKAKELYMLEQAQKKEDQANAEKVKKEGAATEQKYALERISAQTAGRMSLAEKQAELKSLQSDYGVPKNVAQAMQDARRGISANTRSYIASLGGLGQIDPEELARLQASERAQHEASDQAIMARYRAGEFDAKSTNAPSTTAVTPALPTTTAADELAAHQAKMRAAVAGK